MKICLLTAIIIMLLSSGASAVQIITVDEIGYVFKEGKFTEDSHKYKVTYEMDEKNQELIALEEVDLTSGEAFNSDAVYKIIKPPKLEEFMVGVALKAVRINPLLGTIETISFCNGRYNYSKTAELWINLSYGAYKIEP